MVFKATSPDEINRTVTEGESAGQRLSPRMLKYLEVKEFEENSAKEAEQKQPDMLEKIPANVGILEARGRKHLQGEMVILCAKTASSRVDKHSLTSHFY